MLLNCSKMYFDILFVLILRKYHRVYCTVYEYPFYIDINKNKISHFIGQLLFENVKCILSYSDKTFYNNQKLNATINVITKIKII